MGTPACLKMSSNVCRGSDSSTDNENSISNQLVNLSFNLERRQVLKQILPDPVDFQSIMSYTNLTLLLILFFFGCVIIHNTVLSNPRDKKKRFNAGTESPGSATLDTGQCCGSGSGIRCFFAP
jgi:hypothetical protein